MIEAPVSRRGPSAFWCDPGGGRFQDDLSAGNLKVTRRQVRRFARTGMKCPWYVGCKLVPEMGAFQTQLEDKGKNGNLAPPVRLGKAPLHRD